MVHVRLNEKEPNPNPHINFITPLPIGDSTAEEDARQLLRALAAQVKPVMRSHGFVVNSFEEYEYNKVFAGRNWNNGETVEVVLRNAIGTYYPTSWLMSTLCHELAHIKYMNHGPAFQALWARLRRDVRELQNRGYYGDGYWSSGTRLADGAKVGGQGLDIGDLPEYMCGGAQTRARPSSFRRRRTRRTAGPSSHTGAQTAKKRKAGSRVTAKDAFKGEGMALSAGGDNEAVVGTGFGKRAGSKKAREERALAIERRLKMLTQKPEDIATQDQEGDVSSDGEDAPPETDQDRRRTLLETADNLEDLKTSWSTIGDDFVFPSSTQDTKPSRRKQASTSPVAGPSRPPIPSSSNSVIVIEDSDEEPACDTQILTKSSSTATATASDACDPLSASGRPRKKQKTLYGSIVEDEVQHRKKEALGMLGPGRTLGGPSSTIRGGTSQTTVPQSSPSTSLRQQSQPSRTTGVLDNEVGSEWTCLVCTLSNKPEHLACSICATPRGESTWSGDT
ncbi:unnamed protein product [Somion occarium]|uniref:WLM-domain-containing protein n=1 Tax=Somion occarium TaxID=3059160 RepID=A0ABP1EAY5_9APHY